MMRHHRVFATACAAAICAGGVAAASSAAASTAVSRSAQIAAPRAGGPTLNIPAVNHPDVKGHKLEIVWEGTPEASQVTEILTAEILKQWGANVSFQFASGTAIAYADMLHGGAFLADSMVDVLNGFDTGVPLDVVGLAQPKQDYVFVARPGISSLTQLQGKTVGVLDMQGINGAQLLQVLALAHLKQSQVTIDQAGGQSERLAALLSGRLQATMLSHQALTQLSSNYKVLYDYTKSDPTLYDDMWSSSANFIKANSGDVVALNEATLLAFKIFNSKANDNEMFNVVHSIDPALSKSSTISYFDQMRTLDYAPNGSVMNAAALTTQEKQYKAVGAITASPPLSDWAYLKFGTKALSLLGSAAK